MRKILLCDIDGTICDDIPNEQAHLIPTAEVYKDSLELLNKWYDNGDKIHFFTARTEDMREVTEEWLAKHGFKYHSLIMNKPRIKDGETYMWIDNKPVKAVTYKGEWTELTHKKLNVEVFGNEGENI